MQTAKILEITGAMADKLNQKVGETLRRLRLEADLSQEELAERSGLHRTYIGSIERAEKNITIQTTKKLTDALGLSLSDFFSNIEQE